jgi:hypothetical protein
MSWLLDVNLILASRWTTHPDHFAAKAWIDSVDKSHWMGHCVRNRGLLELQRTRCYNQ